ncbi:hypothetical protein ASZ78_006846 [Callipepla squamata]|uniref:Ig-like domain-containing protein n=1 Tax=Callipepla squamata TaxID=9009 RepID=A0A226MDJ5_CALSU|nr:hypothetical protein ASZ78_006846 [Callipepla squamata]
MAFYLFTGQFTSYSPSSTITGVIGQGVVLPCYVVAENIPEIFSVQWIFNGQSQKITVSSYNGKNKKKEQDERYQGRTELFHSEFKAGNMSLHLKNIQSSDKGLYTCIVSFNDEYHDVLIELRVAAKGGVPSIFLRRPKKQGIGLICHADGWFPEPEVIWLNGQGQVRKEQLATKAMMMPSGLYSVQSSMNLMPGSDMEVSCRIVNNLLKTMSESRVLISGNHKKAINSDQEKAMNQRGKLKAELVPITVNAECQLLELQVPGAPDAEEPDGLSSPSTVPILVAKEGFAAGKHYWEVEVGQQQDWVLGVMRQNGKQGEQGTLAGEDFWALHRSQGEIFSSQGNIKLEKKEMSYSVIGVLLDLEEAQINFYEAHQMTNVIKIPIRLGKEPTEMFFPFVSKLGEADTPVIQVVLAPVPLEPM